MKRFLLAIMILLAGSSGVWAAGGEQAISTASTKTADAKILDGAGYFKGFVIVPDGTNNVTITFHDSTTASGDKLLPTMTFAGNGGAHGFTLPAFAYAKNGIYVNITTAGTVEYTVYFSSR